MLDIFNNLSFYKWNNSNFYNIEICDKDSNDIIQVDDYIPVFNKNYLFKYITNKYKVFIPQFYKIKRKYNLCIRFENLERLKWYVKYKYKYLHKKYKRDTIILNHLKWDFFEIWNSSSLRVKLFLKELNEFKENNNNNSDININLKDKLNLIVDYLKFHNNELVLVYSWDELLLWNRDNVPNIFEVKLNEKTNYYKTYNKDIKELQLKDLNLIWINNLNKIEEFWLKDVVWHTKIQFFISYKQKVDSKNIGLYNIFNSEEKIDYNVKT